MEQGVLKRDGARTKKAILKAATKIFAEKGIDGARVDEIADLAGVNKNMLYHHFGNKDDLFVAVLENIYEIIRARQYMIDVRDLEPEEGMRTIIQKTFDIRVKFPEYCWLLSGENFHEGRHVKLSNKIASMHNPMPYTIKGLLERGQKQGVFRDGIDATDLYISISSLSNHYISNHYTFETVLHIDLMTPERLAQRRDHITDMIMRYLAN